MNYYLIKIKGKKDPLVIKDELRGKKIKIQYDSPTTNMEDKFVLKEEGFSGTWKQVEWIEEKFERDPVIKKQNEDLSRGKIMTFQEFKAKYPEKARLLEKNF